MFLLIATTITSKDCPERVTESMPESGKAMETLCLCGAHNHPLEECKERNHKEKLIILREQGVWFACLGSAVVVKLEVGKL